MGHAQAARLIDNSSTVANGDWVEFVGGRAALVTEATTFSTTFQLQYQGLGGAAIDVGSNTAANGVAALDLPMGLYRMKITGGSLVAAYASISKIKY